MIVRFVLIIFIILTGAKLVLGKSSPTRPEFLSSGVITSTSHDSSPEYCGVMSTDVSSPSSKFAGDYECPEAKAIMQHLSGMPALRLSSSATDDSALGAKLWVEREKMAMVENENNHFRKQQVPHPQELELGESAGVSTKASAMMMSRFSNSLRNSIMVQSSLK